MTPAYFQRGLALVMVMWLVAAMSLLVASVVYVARMDVQQQQLGQAAIRASALSDKAMRLSLRQFYIEMADNPSIKQVAQNYSIDSDTGELQVDIYPASGLIHLGSLTPELLLSVLQYGVKISEDKLSILSNVLEGGFASSALAGEDLGLPGRFRALEDLLLIPGVTIDHYELLKDYFYIGQVGSPGVNPAAAPPELLSVLAAGDEGVVEEFISLREEAQGVPGAPVLPHAQFSAGFVSSVDSSVYRVDVTLMTGKYRFQKRYWISNAPSSFGLPWEEQSIEPVKITERPLAKVEN